MRMRLFMHTSCGTCRRIRMFGTVALILIVMIYLQPNGVTRVASLMPSSATIAALMMVGGMLMFAVKLTLYRAHQKAAQAVRADG